jgi:hypothetical protein
MTHFINLPRKQFRAIVSKEKNFFDCVYNPSFSIDNDYYIIENLSNSKFTAGRVRKIKVNDIIKSTQFYELKTMCIFLLDPSL